MRKESYDYDIECYPNYFLATFKNIRTGEWKRFEIFHDTELPGAHINEVKYLVAFFEEEVSSVVGYNNSEYDDTLIKFIYINFEIFTRKGTTSYQVAKSLNILSGEIIKERYGQRSKNVQQIKAVKKFGSLDLLAMFNTVDRVSLKQIAINLRWPSIKDLPFEPAHIVKRDEIGLIKLYCDNDVNITGAVRERKVGDIQFRRELTTLYNVNLMNSNDTDIAKNIIRKFYLEGTGKTWDMIKNLKTYVKTIRLRDCISRRIRFSTKNYMELYNEMWNKTVNVVLSKKGTYNVGADGDSKKLIEKLQGNAGKMMEIMQRHREGKKKEYATIIQSKCMKHTVGLGGIHSINPPQEFIESDEFDYVDADVSAYYPRVIVNEKLYPRHLGPEFTAIYEKEILQRKDEAKASGEKQIEKSAKISANATFGLMKNAYSWLFDPLPPTYICISGQLFLLMLIERLEELTDCRIVYSNTDGITTRVPKGSRAEYDRICYQWMRATGFNLEFVNYKRMVIKDINNYLIITNDEKKPIKQKGIFVTERTLQNDNPSKLLTKSYNFPIIAMALEEYYTRNIPIKTFITSHTDIFHFIKAERTNTHKFDIEFTARASSQITMLPRSNRWVVTNGNPVEGIMVKISKERKTPKGERFRVSMHTNKKNKYHSNRYVTILNDMTDVNNIDHLHLDYDFYIGACNDIINKIPKQRPEGNYELVQKTLF